MSKRPTPILSIVIPSKNEKFNIRRLLYNIVDSQFTDDELEKIEIIVAEAGNLKAMRDSIMSFSAFGPKIKLVRGGLPAVGRNAGAKHATAKYLLFLDADVQIVDPNLLKNALAYIEEHDFDLVTVNIQSSNGGIKDQIMYLANNIVQWCSSYISPFATGMFMLWNRDKFDELGRFDEQAYYAEDYLLSKQVDRKKFSVYAGVVCTSNRRFAERTGYSRVILLMIKTLLNTWNTRYFYRNNGYWD